MNQPHDENESVQKLNRDARGLAVVCGFVCVLMTFMVLAAAKDITTNNPPSVREERVSVLILPVVGWVLKRTVLQSRETRRAFVMIEHMTYAVASGFIWWGAFQMRRFRNYRLSVIAARLALVPWLFTGFPFGLVLGLRALRRLRLPEIKARFDANSQITMS